MDETKREEMMKEYLEFLLQASKNGDLLHHDINTFEWFCGCYEELKNRWNLNIEG